MYLLNMAINHTYDKSHYGIHCSGPQYREPIKRKKVQRNIQANSGNYIQNKCIQDSKNT